MKNSVKGKRGNLSFYIVAGFIVLLVIFPVYWTVVTSCQTLSGIFSYPPRFIPNPFDLSVYIKTFQEGKIFLWIKNSLIVSIGGVTLNAIIATPAAYVIAKTRFRGKKLSLFLVLSTQLLPPALIIVPLYHIFSFFGIIDTFVCLVLVDAIITLPLSVWILEGFFEKIPWEIQEAAQIDGCTKYGVFYHIALPIILPVLLTICIITFYDIWNEFLFATTFITSKSKWLGTVGLSSFICQQIFSWRLMLAHAMLFTLLPMGFYLVFRNRIVRGIAEGFVSK